MMIECSEPAQADGQTNYSECKINGRITIMFEIQTCGNIFHAGFSGGWRCTGFPKWYTALFPTH